MKIIPIHPLLGTGPDVLAYGLAYGAFDEFKSYTDRTTNYIDKAHNEYLNIAATLGIPALVIYLLFIVLIFEKENKKIFKNKPTFILIIPIVSYLAQAFFNISTIGVAPIFWFILGIIQNEEFKDKLESEYN